MLEHFFGSKTRVKLLQIFFRSPERPFYVRELSRLADIQLNAIRRELANLTAIGIIGLREEQVVSQKGLERSKYYQLQKESILFTELQALLTKSQLLEQKVFIDEVLHKAGQIKLFLLSGLFTQDDHSATDLLIVGMLKQDVIEKIIARFEKEFNKTIRYTMMDEKEYEERKELGDVFLYNIFESKYMLVVDEFNLHKQY
jgi:predicted transcriptional regulator